MPDSDDSGDAEPKSPSVASVLEAKPPSSATDEVEFADLESEWPKALSSPRLLAAESESPALVSDGASLLDFFSSSSPSRLRGHRNGPEDGRDEATRAPGPGGLHANPKSGGPKNWDSGLSWSSGEDWSSRSRSEATASPPGATVPNMRHPDPGEVRAQAQAHAPQKTPERYLDEGQEEEEEEEEEREGVAAAPDPSSARRGSAPGPPASVVSSAPSEFYTLLLERLGHMEQRTAAVEARAALGLFLAEAELPAAVAALQDALADVQAQLKLALEARVEARDFCPRPLASLPPLPSGGDPGATVVRALDFVCLAVTVSFALAVILMWLLYPLF